MPYTLQNKALYRAAHAADYFTVDNARLLMRQLRAVDYSAVESRCQGHASLLEFINTGTVGRDIFNVNKQWPSHPTYITTFNVKVDYALVALQATLSQRPQTYVKDTKNDRQQGQAQDDRNAGKETDEQALAQLLASNFWPAATTTWRASILVTL